MWVNAFSDLEILPPPPPRFPLLGPLRSPLPAWNMLVATLCKISLAVKTSSWESRALSVFKNSDRKHAKREDLSTVAPHSRHYSETFKMGPVRIRHSSHNFATQSTHSVDLAGWQGKMASIVGYHDVCAEALFCRKPVLSCGLDRGFPDSSRIRMSCPKPRIHHGGDPWTELSLGWRTSQEKPDSGLHWNGFLPPCGCLEKLTQY